MQHSSTADPLPLCPDLTDRLFSPRPRRVKAAVCFLGRVAFKTCLLVLAGLMLAAAFTALG